LCARTLAAATRKAGDPSASFGIEYGIEGTLAIT
jgi:hypothetical protein